MAGHLMRHEGLVRDILETAIGIKRGRGRPRLDYCSQTVRDELLVRNNGYPFQQYQVPTEDGYILTLFRIPHNGTDTSKKRTPVLLVHGIAFDSTTFLLLGKKSPAFILSNNGHDVWLANVRGSTYSSRHVKYNVYDQKFWDFSFHEIGIYDIPALVNFITSRTGQKGNLALLGYSMGTTTSLIYASTRPKHAKANVKTIVALAPVAFMDNTRSVVKILATHNEMLQQILGPLAKSGIGENLQFLVGIVKQMCVSYPALVLCGIAVEMFTGLNPGEIKPETLPVIFSEAPSGFSLKTFTHYAQIMTTNRRFQQYDYGQERNLKMYNSTLPPEYRLSNIRVPVHLFYGKNDLLSDEKDVATLYDVLKTEKTMRSVFEEDQNYYSHSDFTIGKSCSKLFRIISQYIGS